MPKIIAKSEIIKFEFTLFSLFCCQLSVACCLSSVLILCSLFFVLLKMFTYNTISSSSEGIYREKGSKFLAFAIPVSNVDEIKEILKDFRKKYYDARHVCYAYMLGTERIDFRVNDDGEPTGTAGRPILGQINSLNLTNILVVVVRYFGGILLGTGGLITAYKEAAADALQNATIVEKEVTSIYILNFDYLVMNDVMQIIKMYNIAILSQQFEEKCRMKIEVPRQIEELIVGKIKEKADNMIKLYN